MMNIRINAPDVIHESFDDESVIVNLRAGIYFSLNEAGLPLWDLIGKGAAEAQLCEAWRERHQSSNEDAQRVVRAFLQELHREQLIAGDFDGAFDEPAGEPPAAMPRPELQKFTDLQDLLMLDPVHDVDDRGWPHARPKDDVAT